MRTLIVIALIVSITVNCWPILPDDSGYWKNQGELFSIKNFQRFNESIKTRNASAMVTCIKDLKIMMNRINRHNQKGFPFIGHMVVVINKLINSNLDQNWINARLLEFLVNAIDGNRDNMSYYLLSGSYDWVTKRVSALYDTNISPDSYPSSDNQTISDKTLDDLRKNMTNIGLKILNVRENLGNMNGVIVKSIKDIVTYVRDVKTYQDEIKSVGTNMTIAYRDSNDIIRDTDEVINYINVIIDGIKNK